MNAIVKWTVVVVLLIVLGLFVIMSVRTESFTNPREQAFTTIYRQRLWGTEHPNGFGSLPVHTMTDQRVLCEILQRWKIETMLDVPCGTVSWIANVLEQYPSLQYTGMDIVKDQILDNQRRFPQHTFVHADMTLASLGRYDLIFSKEGTQHMTKDATLAFLGAVKRSGSKYLCVTHYEIPENREEAIDPRPGIPDLPSGAYREQNFRLPPYNVFPTVLGQWWIRKHISTQSSQYLLLMAVSE